MSDPVLQFNRRLCPTSNPGSVQMFGQAIMEWLRTGDPDFLPPGVTVIDLPTTKRKGE